MSLIKQRDSIRHLLNFSDPVDAQDVYYAYHHPDERTSILTYPKDTTRAEGFLTFSRTGMDLFRPLITLRIPSKDYHAGFNLINTAVPVGTPVIIFTSEEYEPLLRALFDFESETIFRLLALDRSRFEPIINVLVTQSRSPNGLPRFVIRSSAHDNMVTASAGLNWETPQFAEIRVQTEQEQRRQGWGKSVLAAMINHLLQSGRLPLYLVEEHNAASYNLATSTGFVDTGSRKLLIHGIRKETP